MTDKSVSVSESVIFIANISVIGISVILHIGALLAKSPRFAKFANFFPLQNFPTYGILFCHQFNNKQYVFHLVIISLIHLIVISPIITHFIIL